MSADDLVLSVRAAKLAERVGAATVGDLVLFTEQEILSAKCFGETSLRELREKLAVRGLRLGMSRADLRGRRGLQGKIVRQGTAEAVADAEHEGECCGHCEAAARALRERTAGLSDSHRREKDMDMQSKLNMSLAELELSIRATNCLESEGITTVRDLVIRTEDELLEVRNFGVTTLREVKAKLAAIGLSLGMNQLWLWLRQGGELA
jgi:DNA-directed RNA polymerase alpha subunit